MDTCVECNVLSIEEALEVIKYRESNMEEGFAAAKLTESFTGMIRALKRMVEGGQEIY